MCWPSAWVCRRGSCWLATDRPRGRHAVCRGALRHPENPHLAWIALIFGIGFSTAALSAAVFAIFPVVVLVAAGTRDVDPNMVTVAVSMGASRAQVGRKVLLPAVLPSVMTAMRVAMVFALLGALLAEMLAGNRGMGFQMQRVALAFRAPELFAATAIVSVLSISAVLFLEHLNRRLGRWR
jgi:NitT/TauT family transport system permease protein